MTKETDKKIGLLDRIFNIKPASLGQAIKDLKEFNLTGNMSKQVEIRPVLKNLEKLSANSFYDYGEISQSKGGLLNKLGMSSPPVPQSMVEDKAGMLLTTHRKGKTIGFTNNTTTFWFSQNHFSTTRWNVPVFGKGQGVIQSRVYAIKGDKEVSRQDLTNLMLADTAQKTDEVIKNTGLVKLDKEGKLVAEASFDNPIIGDKILSQGGYPLLMESISPLVYMNAVERKRAIGRFSKEDARMAAWNQKASLEFFVKGKSWLELQDRIDALEEELNSMPRDLNGDVKIEKRRQKLKNDVNKIRQAMGTVIDKTIDKHDHIETLIFDPGFISLIDSKEFVKNINEKRNSKNLDSKKQLIFEVVYQANKYKKEIMERLFEADRPLREADGLVSPTKSQPSEFHSPQYSVHVTQGNENKSEEKSLLEGLQEVTNLVVITPRGSDNDYNGAVGINFKSENNSNVLQMPAINLGTAQLGAQLLFRAKQIQKSPDGFSLKFTHCATNRSVSINSEAPKPDNDLGLD